MGAFCAKSLDSDDNYQSTTARRNVKEMTKEEAAINAFEMKMKIFDNKAKIVRDKINEFMEQSVQTAIDEAMVQNSKDKDLSKDKLNFLSKFKKDCDTLLVQLDDLHMKRTDLRIKTQQLNTNESGENEDLIERLKKLHEQYKDLRNQLSVIEKGFSQQFVEFLSYKDNADLIDNFESALVVLAKEYPLIQSSINKVTKNVDHFEVFISQVLQGNVNYDEQFALKELDTLAQQKYEHGSLSKRCHKMLSQISEVESLREEVLSKKFSDPSFVSDQFNIMLDVVANRNKCRKKFARFKNNLREARDKYSDMQVDQIQQQLESRLQKVITDVKELIRKNKKKLQKQQTEEAGEGDLETQSRSEEYQKYQDRGLEITELLKVAREQIEQVNNLDNCPIEELSQIVAQQKKINEELLKLEVEAALAEIKFYNDKLVLKSSQIEPLLIALNETKQRMPDDDLDAFERMRQDYVKVKQNAEQISNTYQTAFVPNTDNMWSYKRQVQKIQADAVDLKNFNLEIKIVWQRASKIPVPTYKKFSDIVDQMLFDFKEIKRIDVFIQKLSPHNYIFGTKKIYAKVCNGILLIRVGGGFMDIDNFYLNYGEQELIRQSRKEDRHNNIKQKEAKAMDLFLASKKAAKKLNSRKSNLDNDRTITKDESKKSRNLGTNSSSSDTFTQSNIYANDSPGHDSHHPGDFEISLDLVAKHKAKAEEKEQLKRRKSQDNKDVNDGNDEVKEEEEQTIMSNTTFEELGVCSELCEALKAMGYKAPTKIQAESLPYTLKDRDMIGLAETGSGKTASFAIPVIQKLLDNPQPFFACVMSPTRELCVQIAEQFEAIGSTIGLRTAVLVGGLDMVSQAIALSKNPHVVIGTPGRLADHLANTKGFNLKKLKFLVFDEADRLLSMDFEKQINLILTQIPKNRNTYLFSATMTSKVQKLQRASLNDPVKIEVSSKYKTVDTLVQNYIFIPEKHKETYLVYLLTQFTGQKLIIFTTTCNQSMKLALILRNLNFKAVNINGQLTQTQRLSALNKFKANERNILIATDVASRGLDIPEVDFVINYDIPQHSKDYVHRVGRTARAGKTGRAITFVTQYDVETFQKIEQLIGKKLEEYPGLDSKAAMILTDSVVEAQRLAVMEMKSREGKGGKSVDGPEDEDDDNQESNKDMKLFGKKRPNNFAHKKGFNSNKSFARKRPRKS